MKQIDILGLKNFRIFDDQNGFLEEFSSLNLITGANNSGKSSIIKALQMLGESIRESRYPFNLDLNRQHHLLGDFDNVLFNKKNRKIEITLPFIFMGVTNFCISLSFEAGNSYKARLRGIQVIDKTDMGILFSFHYRDARNAEKKAYKEKFSKELQDFKDSMKERSKEGGSVFTPTRLYLFEPYENPLTGYVVWSVNLQKLKKYSSDLKWAYEHYLGNKKQWTGENLEELDGRLIDNGFIPSSFIKSFKKDADIKKWEDFHKKIIGRKKTIKGKEHIGERDFEADDMFIPPSEIEDLLFYQTREILKDKLKWKDLDSEHSEYSIIEYAFNNSWENLINRIATINYVSNIKEENARSYNVDSNSPFVNLLKNYESADLDTHFIIKYLKAFEIGKKITVELNPKYQSILVSITTLDGTQRELVDFGYGIKQLVLILMQISVLAQKNKRYEHVYGYDGEAIEERYDPSLLIIEEPESNLHPKWQSLLADMFTEANRKFNIQMIIETHSEYLIRKFQTLVAQKQVDAKQVKIFYLRGLNKISSVKKQIEKVFIQDDGGIDVKIFDDGFFDENYKLELSLLEIRRDNFLSEFETLKNDLQNNEEKIDALQIQIDEFTANADVAVYEQIINQRFTTSKLLSLTVSYMVSGQYLLKHIDSSGDYSPVILQYGRAIENELKRIFVPINSTINWVIGPMQGSLEKFKNMTTTMAPCSNVDYAYLPGQLLSMFVNPNNLRIDLLNDLRDVRNSAGHSGHVKNYQEALDYIHKAGEFLDAWILELL